MLCSSYTGPLAALSTVKGSAPAVSPDEKFFPSATLAGFCSSFMYLLNYEVFSDPNYALKNPLTVVHTYQYFLITSWMHFFFSLALVTMQFIIFHVCVIHTQHIGWYASSMAAESDLFFIFRLRVGQSFWKQREPWQTGSLISHNQPEWSGANSRMPKKSQNY